MKNKICSRDAARCGFVDEDGLFATSSGRGFVGTVVVAGVAVVDGVDQTWGDGTKTSQ